MKYTLPIFALIFLLFGCAAEEKKQPPVSDGELLLRIDKEIAQLNTDHKLKLYWENINRLDQLYRKKESAIVQQYGHGSKEYKDIWEQINKTDEINLLKTEKLLAKYGHPKKDSLGRKAAYTPFIVIHHSNSYEAKERNFPYLYRAYKNGDLDDDGFSFYLNRMYSMKFGERMTVGGVYREEERIAELIEKLGLETGGP
ncbi:MAG TPA: hypothetical protein ENJ95_17495 [Bacteroidetes bacterium]|nr:hypothetical protein [Bacteroidota bacterium]